MLVSQISLTVFLLFIFFFKGVLTNENADSDNTSLSSSETSEPVGNILSLLTDFKKGDYQFDPYDVWELIRLIFNITIPEPEHEQPIENHSHSLQRVKRQQQQGESKYTQASKMPETKIIRLAAQMLANPFSSAYIGGGHPFHPEVPKSIVILFKQKIMDFLFPRIGDRF